MNISTRLIANGRNVGSIPGKWENQSAFHITDEQFTYRARAGCKTYLARAHRTELVRSADDGLWRAETELQGSV